MAFTQTAKTFLADNAPPQGSNFVDNLVNKYIVKPKNAKGIGGFVFDYEGETDIQLQAEITDHFSENNTSINDHIAIRPIKINLRGFVTELLLLKDTALTGFINSVQNKLTTVPAFLGKYTPQGLAQAQKALTQAQNTINTINQGVARVQNLVGFFSNAAQRPTRQSKAYAQLEALMQTKQIFSVETPYRYFENMAIETIHFIQPEESKYLSDISITLKQTRFVNIQAANNQSFQNGRAAFQRQDEIDKDKTQGIEVDMSALFKASTFFKKEQ